MINQISIFLRCNHVLIYIENSTNYLTKNLLKLLENNKVLIPSLVIPKPVGYLAKTLELISYRFSTNEFLGLKPYIYTLSGLMGLGVSSLYNNQRNTRLDESWYYRFYGITAGLIFSSELYEALSTILTPTETFILSQEKYEKNKR